MGMGFRERGVAAESGDAAVGIRVRARDRTLRTRVLHGEGNPRRLGREEQADEITSEVETLSKRGGDGKLTSLPPLSFGDSAVALVVEESDSPKGQVLLLGGCDENSAPLSTVHLVDLATGVCRPQLALLDTRVQFMATRLPDGRVVCAGGCTSHA